MDKFSRIPRTLYMTAHQHQHTRWCAKHGVNQKSPTILDTIVERVCGSAIVDGSVYVFCVFYAKRA
jgi:hypothetical protein